MTIQYKVQGYDLTTTDLTTVLTINSQSVAIIKEISISNDHNNTVELDYYFNDASTSTTYKFYHAKIAANTTNNAVRNALVLEEGDSLDFQAAGANYISGQISYALINRTQQNG